MGVAIHLRELRSAAGLSQARLAERAGLSPLTVSHYETGRRTPGVPNLCRLADALGCTTDQLLGAGEDR